jgi:hypothetical protein
MEKMPTHDQRTQERFHDALMTYQEYAQIKHPRPYEYRLVSGDKEIIFFGPGHSNDPNNPAFEHIREQLDTQKPDLVLVEGMESLNKLQRDELKELMDGVSDIESIKKYGEGFFTAKLAVERGIKVVSPEPSDALAIAYLEQHSLSREAIFAQQLASLIAQYARTQTKPDFETYLAPYLGRMSAQFRWKDFDFSLDHFRAIHQEIFGAAFDLENTQLYREACDPVPWEGKVYSQTNRVAAAWGEFRDRFIIDAIQDHLEKYKKLFIVYGASHAVIQEPALRKMMAYEPR